jgi:hypothetical protein
VSIDRLDSRVSILLENWEQVEKLLSSLFEKRERQNTRSLMEQGLDIFMELLFLTNDMPIDNDVELSSLKWKPINVTERLSFINRRPELYHSFIQIKELFSEQKKICYKKLAIEKVTKH